MDDIPFITPARARLVVAAMLISTFMAAAEVTIISTAMPTIVADVGGFALFSWAFGIYLVAQAVMTPIYGRLADLYGRRAAYLGSAGVFLAGSLLCGLAWSMPSLIVFRAIQGLGGAGLIPLATVIIGDVCAPAQRARVLGYVSAVWGVAAIVGPLIGSAFVSTIGWPYVFWINLPVGAVTMLLVARNLRDPVRSATAGRIDLVGVALLTGAIVPGMAALIQFQALPGPWLAGLGAVSALCLAAFIALERSAADPLLAGALLQRRVILGAVLSALLCGALLIEFTAFLPTWVQGVMGRDALASGVVLGVMTIFWAACSLGLGRFLVRLPLRGVALGAGLLLACGSAMLLWLGGAWVWLLAGSAVLGVGLGASSLAFTVTVQSSVGWGDRGRATSLFYFSRLLGQALGAAAFGGVLNHGLARVAGAQDALRDLMDPALRLALPAAELARLGPVLASALVDVFGAGLLVSALAASIVLLLPRRPA